MRARDVVALTVRLAAQVMAVGVPLACVFGGGVCWVRLVYAWRTALKFRGLEPGIKPRLIHRFLTEFDVEVASRIGRVWDEEGVPDPTSLDLAEDVLKARVTAERSAAGLQHCCA